MSQSARVDWLLVHQAQAGASCAVRLYRPSLCLDRSSVQPVAPVSRLRYQKKCSHGTGTPVALSQKTTPPTT
jgi:hypothetical protein